MLIELVRDVPIGPNIRIESEAPVLTTARGAVNEDESLMEIETERNS